MQIINASIDLEKIKTAKTWTSKSGKTFVNVAIIVSDNPDQYGNNVSIQEAQSKEERANKAPRNYLGNGKTS